MKSTPPTIPDDILLSFNTSSEKQLISPSSLSSISSGDQREKRSSETVGSSEVTVIMKEIPRRSQNEIVGDSRNISSKTDPYSEARRRYKGYKFAPDGTYPNARVWEKSGLCLALTSAGMAYGPGKYAPRQDQDSAEVAVVGGEIVAVRCKPELPFSPSEIAFYSQVLDKSKPHDATGLYSAYLEVRPTSNGFRYLRAQHPYLLTTAWCVAPDLPYGAYVGDIECRLRDLPDGRVISVITSCIVHGIGEVISS